MSSLPASWTSVAEVDPFVVAAAGRSLFRVRDLVGLVDLVTESERRSVKEITPDV